MEFRANFRHMAVSDAVKEYAERKLVDSVKTYVAKPMQLTVTFEVEGSDYHTSCHVFGDGLSLQVEARVDTNMYSCVDLLQDKLEETLRRRKDRLTDHKRDREVTELLKETRDSRAQVLEEEEEEVVAF
jgi:ribosomal subunit interface protein